MTKQHTSLFTRVTRRTASVLSDINYAQRRLFEIMTSPTGE
jgi:hypothetical protein